MVMLYKYTAASVGHAAAAAAPPLFLKHPFSSAQRAIIKRKWQAKTRVLFLKMRQCCHLVDMCAPASPETLTIVCLLQ